MKFYPPKIVRYFLRYIILLIFVIFPLYFIAASAYDSNLVKATDRPYFILLGCIISIIGIVIVSLVFWEKCFSILIINENCISLVCPFKRTKTLFVDECVEIGGYLENANSGIPHEQIYFSNYHNPYNNACANGFRKNKNLIKFWYSEELCNYLIKHHPSKKTSCLVVYRRQKGKC